jgi:hypothetical protein
MFERFTAGAREVVVLAQDEARGLRDAPGRRVRNAAIEELSRRGDVPGHPA